MEVEDDVEPSVLIVHYWSFVAVTFAATAVDVVIVSTFVVAFSHLVLVVVLVFAVATAYVNVFVAEHDVLFHLALSLTIVAM